MPRLIKRGAVADDPAVVVRETTGELPQGVPLIVPLARWQADRDVLAARGDVGVWLAPAQDPFELAGDLSVLRVIAVDFPKFTDGRGYSTARLLRERLNYTRELRAIGDVQRDQLYYLSQVGFDAFVMASDDDVEGAVASLRDFSDGYQLTLARTPWFRRRDAQATAP
jgi:uncharacterized protein (DUF934 family)